MVKPSTPWGYKIDYDKSVAEDESWVEYYSQGGVASRAIAAWSVVEEHATGRGWTMATILNAREIVIVALMMSMDAVRSACEKLAVPVEHALSIVAYEDNEGDAYAADVVAAADVAFPNLRDAGRVYKTITLGEMELCSEDERRRRLAKFKARRAAHLRNAQKYGRR